MLAQTMPGSVKLDDRTVGPSAPDVRRRPDSRDAQHVVAAGAVASSRPAAAVRCREIEDRDIDNLIPLLTRGFAVRSPDYWARALDRLRRHPTPAGLPKFGYLLEHAQRPVGVFLLISSAVPDGVRCNVSSWYVEPAFRSYATWLVLRALRHKNVTYVNVSPAPHTRTTIGAQGFSRYSNGQLLALPMLGARVAGVVVQPIDVVARPQEQALAADYDLLKAHADLGCLCLWCTFEGRAYPFAFLPRRIAKGLVPVAQLVYCRDQDDVVRFAGPIGRHLAARGRPLVLMDAHGPIPGLAGKFFAGDGPKYFRGPKPPRLGDLAFTEMIIFGA